MTARGTAVVRSARLAGIMLAIMLPCGQPSLSAKGAATPQLFAENWIDGTLPQEPEVQVQALDNDSFVIRQSVKTNFEAPFLYLLFGRDKALLIDTGAEGGRIRPAVDRLVAQWRKERADLIAGSWDLVTGKIR